MDLERRLYEALKRHIENPRSPRPDLFKAPSTGTVRQTDHGPIWMVETAYDVGYLHGQVELHPEIPCDCLRILDPACRRDGFAFANAAVVDTETTGLAGGTGTYPFIIGIGRWMGEQFVVRQYILRDFFEEPAQLRAFVGDLEGTTSILTYNGKTFDIPLLRTRFRINRMEPPFESHTHLDFMHPCRRLYKRHFPSLDLMSLEERLLGFERVEDVPRHLIPRIYFDYLQHRDDNVLLPILNHNRDDIVGLYLLAQETIRRIELALANSCDDDLLLLALGHIFFRAGETRRAIEMLSFMKPQYAVSDGLVDEFLMLRSRAAKRLKDWETAVDSWKRMQKTGRFGHFPFAEMAKHQEHHLKDIKAALEMTRLALRTMEFERHFISAARYRSITESLVKRQARLMKKCGEDSH
jgi:hypothetical protein